MSILMKVTAFVGSSNQSSVDAALKYAEALYKELFMWCSETEKTSEVNNSILVYLGLIKARKSIQYVLLHYYIVLFVE